MVVYITLCIYTCMCIHYIMCMYMYVQYCIHDEVLLLVNRCGTMQQSRQRHLLALRDLMK